MLTRKQKQQLTKELSEKIKKGKAVVICDYKGMTVSDFKELRDALREEDSSLQVVKKTLMKLSLENAGVELDPSDLEGQVALVCGGIDEISSAKILYKYGKGNDKLKIVAGSLEGSVLSKEEIVNLAKLPSKEELLGKVVGTIKAPISGFVNVLSGNMRNLVGVLNAIKENK